MTYLFDTHTFLWILNTPNAIPAPVQDICKSHSSILLISIVTPWEMAIKNSIGKLDATYVLDNFEALLIQGGYQLLDTTIKQVIRGGRLPAHHKDPFDRLLAAQALELGVPIISRDKIFDLYGVKRIWD
jgi:PIN domain nuclease of toxin-antitoxin system